MVYIVAEYCTQSHLSTEEYQAASQGLLWTRRFKKRTVWFRKLLGLADTMASMAWRIVLFPFHAATGRKLRSPLSKSLVWDWKAKEGSAQSNQTRAASAQNFRRSDAVLVPLIDKDQDERSSRDSRTPDRSEVEEEQNLEHNVQGHDRVNVVAPSNRMATLQLPSEAHPRSH